LSQMLKNLTSQSSARSILAYMNASDLRIVKSEARY